MPGHSIEFLVAQAFYRFLSHSIECLILHIARSIYTGRALILILIHIEFICDLKKLCECECVCLLINFV